VEHPHSHLHLKSPFPLAFYLQWVIEELPSNDYKGRKVNFYDIAGESVILRTNRMMLIDNSVIHNNNREDYRRVRKVDIKYEVFMT
jgi:hypothetical protein